MCNHDGNDGNGDTQWKIKSEYCRLYGQESAQWKPWNISAGNRGFQVRILARVLFRVEKRGCPLSPPVHVTLTTSIL